MIEMIETKTRAKNSPMIPNVEVLANLFKDGLKLTRKDVAYVLNITTSTVSAYIHLVNRFGITITKEKIKNTNRCLYMAKVNNEKQN